MTYPYPEDVKAHRGFWGLEAELEEVSAYAGYVKYFNAQYPEPEIRPMSPEEWRLAQAKQEAQAKIDRQAHADLDN